MRESRESEPLPTAGEQPQERSRRMTAARVVLALLAAAVIAFAIGYLLNWSRVRTAQREVGELRQELALTRLQSRMGSAVVEANRSNFESARRHMTGVFQEMQSRLEEVEPPLRQRFEEALAERDEIITLLSRASAEATGRLVLMYSRTWGSDAGPAARAAEPAD